jgi:hypothetical protein
VAAGESQVTQVTGASGEVLARGKERLLGFARSAGHHLFAHTPLNLVLPSHTSSSYHILITIALPLQYILADIAPLPQLIYHPLADVAPLRQLANT